MTCELLSFCLRLVEQYFHFRQLFIFSIFFLSCPGKKVEKSKPVQSSLVERLPRHYNYDDLIRDFVAVKRSMKVQSVHWEFLTEKISKPQLKEDKKAAKQAGAAGFVTNYKPRRVM